MTCGNRPDRRHPVSAEPESVVALSRELISQNHAEISRADAKASILLAAGGSLFGLLVVNRPPGGPHSQPLWWTAAACTAVALLLLLAVLLPRHRPSFRMDAQALAYYEDVVRAERRTELSHELVRDSRDPRPRLFRALTGTSRVARAKNRCVLGAVLMLLPATAAGATVLLAGV